MSVRNLRPLHWGEQILTDLAVTVAGAPVRFFRREAPYAWEFGAEVVLNGTVYVAFVPWVGDDKAGAQAALRMAVNRAIDDGALR